MVKIMDKMWISNLRVFNIDEGYDINFYDHNDKEWKQIICSKDEIELELLPVLMFIENNKERYTKLELKDETPHSTWCNKDRCSLKM